MAGRKHQIEEGNGTAEAFHGHAQDRVGQTALVKQTLEPERQTESIDAQSDLPRHQLTQEVASQQQPVLECATDQYESGHRHVQSGTGSLILAGTIEMVVAIVSETISAGECI